MEKLSQEAIQLILGIKEKVCVDPLDMARNLKVTFFPREEKAESHVKQFSSMLKKTLLSLGAEIIPYDKTLVTIIDKKGTTRTGVKRGISIISVGEQETGKLPIDVVESFGDNPIVSLLDWPKDITETSPYKLHIDVSTQLFAANMATLVICVSKDQWLTYSYNGSYPIYQIMSQFVLYGNIIISR